MGGVIVRRTQATGTALRTFQAPHMSKTYRSGSFVLLCPSARGGQGKFKVLCYQMTPTGKKSVKNLFLWGFGGVEFTWCLLFLLIWVGSTRILKNNHFAHQRRCLGIHR